MNVIIPRLLKPLALGAAIAAVLAVSVARPAQADQSSTAIYVGAAAIVGALLIDGNNHPYYVRDNRRYYVTQGEASYYRSHHHMMVRRAYVPENEYPVARRQMYRH
jgi:hypothetical protein